jgi:hypothetical protein
MNWTQINIWKIIVLNLFNISYFCIGRDNLDYINRLAFMNFMANSIRRARSCHVLSSWRIPSDVWNHAAFVFTFHRVPALPAYVTEFLKTFNYYFSVYRVSFAVPKFWHKALRTIYVFVWDYHLFNSTLWADIPSVDMQSYVMRCLCLHIRSNLSILKPLRNDLFCTI